MPWTHKQERNARGKKNTQLTQPKYAQISPRFPRQTFVEDRWDSDPLPSLKLRARSWFRQDGIPKRKDCLPTLDFPFLLSTNISRNVVVTCCNPSHRSWNVVRKKLETTTTTTTAVVANTSWGWQFIPSFTRFYHHPRWLLGISSIDNMEPATCWVCFNASITNQYPYHLTGGAAHDGQTGGKTYWK